MAVTINKPFITASDTALMLSEGTTIKVISIIPKNTKLWVNSATEATLANGNKRVVFVLNNGFVWSSDLIEINDPFVVKITNAETNTVKVKTYSMLKVTVSILIIVLLLAYIFKPKSSK